MQTTLKFRSYFLAQSSWPLSLLVIILGSLALGCISQISIPFQPVPVTLQSITVIFLGISLGWQRATSIVALYLVEGAIGLPVFAEAKFGIATLVGTNGGYLVGFLPAAFVTGYLMERGLAKTFLRTLLCATIGTAMIYLFGIIWLQALVGWHNAYLFGVAPFLAVAPIKLIAVSLLAKPLWKRVS